MDKRMDLLNVADDPEKQEELILRDRLALMRTRLANERTLFSYVRTSLYLLTAGIGILEIKSFSHLKIIACLCLFFSGLLFLAGFLSFCRLRKRLKKYAAEKSSSVNTAGH